MKVWVIETYQPFSDDYWRLDKIFKTFEDASKYAEVEYINIRYCISEWEVEEFE